MNGTYPNDTYRFKEFKTTYSNAMIATKLFDEPRWCDKRSAYV